MHGTEENDNQRDSSFPQIAGTDFRESESDEKMSDEARCDYMSQSDAPSSINCMDATDSEPVDFENNGLLWLPPEPEYIEDDSEGDFSDEDDASKQRGRLRSSKSFVSEESQSRAGTNEEHTKAMEHGVDGRLRALVSQLQLDNIPVDNENDIESWLDVITRLSLEAATFLKPDTSKGDAMDPSGYLKVKCIPCGHRSDRYSFILSPLT